MKPYTYEYNQDALDNPQPGDYWTEMGSPYFFVVEVKGDKIKILNFIDRDNNAYIDCKSHWEIDYSKTMIVDRDYIKNTVKYKAMDGFVADVSRIGHSKKNAVILDEWRDETSKRMKEQILALQEEWEEFTGWKQLKESI